MTSIIITVVISALLSMVGIGSSVAFNNLVSVTVVGLYASYLLAICLLFYRRVTHAIKSSSEFSETTAVVNNPGASLVWGPFRMPGLFGILVNAVAIVYLTVTFVFAFWPGAVPVTPASMNYSSLVFGAVVLFSLGYYINYGRHTYEGPVVNLD